MRMILNISVKESEDGHEHGNAHSYGHEHSVVTVNSFGIST